MARVMLSTTPDFRERYSVLLDIGRVLSGTLEPDELYRTIYEQASRVLETTGFFVSLYEPDHDLATIVFSADRGVIERPGLTYRGSESRAIRERTAVREELDHPDRAIMILGPDSDEEVTRSVIATPLVRDDRVLGVISAQSYRAGCYTDDDLELLSAIARVAAVAIETARSIKALERQHAEARQLEEVSRALTASLDLNEVLERIVQSTRELAEADGAGVWLVRTDGRAELATTAGEFALPRGTTVEVNEGLRRRFVEEMQPVRIQPDGADAVIPDEILDILEAESAIGVPLIAEGELVGALSVSHMQPRRYTPDVVRLLQRFAFNAAIAVANARLHDQVRTLSMTDPLTRLPNRRSMDMFLEKEFAAAERGRSLTVVMFDLNDFKAYNDTAGHQAGDAVLRRFGEILIIENRTMNLAARYGGDEFICILPDTDEDGGAALVRRIDHAVRRDDTMGSVTVSAGIARYEPGMGSIQELVRKADEALYRAKWTRRQNPTTGDGDPA